MKTKDTTCSRRDFLKAATSASMITVVSGISMGCYLLAPDLETVAQRMIDTLNHHHRAREIGVAYMAQAPHLQEQTPEQLTRHLLERLELDHEEISYTTLRSLDERLSQQKHRDFTEENVVIVGKWMFSETEALLCALTALST